MPYLVLGLVILLAIALMVVAIMARQHWRWFHVTTVITVMILAVLFLFPTAGVLRSRAAWNQLHEKLQAQNVKLERELRELKYGDVSNPAVGRGVLELNQELQKSLLEAGRRWRGLRPQGIQNDTVTLVAAAPAADGLDADGLGVDPAADGAGGDNADEPPSNLAMPGLIVYGFSEQIDPVTQQPVPIGYLGEYRILSSTPTQVVIKPTYPLHPTQVALVNNAQQWTLYEMLPLDSHRAFLAEGSKRSEENYLGRVDSELVKRLFGQNVPATTLEQYLQDGRQLRDDDPPATRWIEVELDQPYPIEVDDTELNQPISDGRPFDAVGRAIDVRLKRAEGGEITFKKGERLLLKQEFADKLLEEGVARKINAFYFRPLNDYRFILQELRLKVREAEARIEELQFEQAQLTAAKKNGSDNLVTQQDRKDKLEKDAGQVTTEREATEKFLATIKGELAAMRESIGKTYAGNLLYEERLEGYHRLIQSRLDGVSMR
ncbi:MAG: hypothetical protein AAF958_09520 [Planctomycetota bacterium]